MCECIDKRAKKYNDQCVCAGDFQYIGGICQCGAGLKQVEYDDFIGVGRRLGAEGFEPDGDHDGHEPKCACVDPMAELIGNQCFCKPGYELVGGKCQVRQQGVHVSRGTG